MTFYLKYRPQKIAELDLERVRKELGMILESGRLAHAYLFVGPRGTGKTSAARILAKVVNCKKNNLNSLSAGRKLQEPCGTCIQCKEIMGGTALDLIEIDAASNRGIDDVRELREGIKMVPTQAGFKVYIIDEVHMLTNEAFNALLKTLEEPPSHALFVLCTTDPHKIPETIRSRCTEILFQKANIKEVVGSLMKIIGKEKIKYEDGVLEEIAKSVDGSFRDGMKILEQLNLRLMSDKKKKEITIKDVWEVVGLGGEETSQKFLEMLMTGDRKGAFEFVESMNKKAVSCDQFIREFLEYLRKLLLIKIGVFEGDAIEGLDINSIKRLVEIFSKAAYEMKTAVIQELPLEIAIVECMEDRNFNGESNEFKDTEKKKGDLRKSGLGRKNDDKQEKEVAEKQPVDREKVKVTIKQVREKWPQVLEKLRPQNHSLEALLKAANPVEINGYSIITEVAYVFHKEQLEIDRYRRMVEAMVSEVIGDGLKLKYVLKKRPVKVEVKIKEHDNLSGDIEDEEVLKAAEEIFGE